MQNTNNLKFPDQKLNILVNLLSNNGIYPNKENLRFFFKTLFKGIDFRNKNVLDIGGGSGVLSFYAAAMGAQKVICLEPISDGSYKKMGENFSTIKKETKLKNTELLPMTFQEYNSPVDKFDIIILYNSINHLDEGSCKSLQYDDESMEIYNNIFKKMHQMANKGCTIIISDCSRYNFFGFLGLNNPFEPNIDWDIHQSPYFWAKMLRKQNFKNQKIIWNSFNSLRIFGRILLGNRYCSYFFSSHFTLKMNT